MGRVWVGFGGFGRVWWFGKGLEVCEGSGGLGTHNLVHEVPG